MARKNQRTFKRIDDLDLKVAERVRARRTALGISQQKLADALGVTFQQVQKYEKATNRISTSRLQTIADVLGVSVSFFFGEGGSSHAKGESEMASLAAFLSTPDGMTLSRSFMRIKRKDLRRQIRLMVEAIVSSND